MDINNNYDVAVVGAGHAGCEAALACARMGLKTVMFAINLDSVAMMPCNPNVGGAGKGHLAREIDALGGEMGKNIDKTFIQSRLLNTGKGPAVYSLRAQADKYRYSLEMKKVCENTPNLTLKQAEIVDLSIKNGEVRGVLSGTGVLYGCRAAVICGGTYQNARCLTGDTATACGPNGFRGSYMLSVEGVRLRRFKTGTPARVDARTVDFSQMEPQYGDENIVPFSFDNEYLGFEGKNRVVCHLTHTNERTHDIIRQNLHRSPLYAGVIEGVGPRYCPSIEDKVVRFADKPSHQVFVEPEGLDTKELYISGMSTSMPEDVQMEMYRTVPGLQNCVITRPGYAIEYDCVCASDLKLSLEAKNCKGLFFAGQINGSSGYEEAAAQGLIAGINAACYCKNLEALVLDRSEAYIGVLIDDLVVKENYEPYRIITGRVEYRLLLRQDNADLRLTEKGYKLGLISEERYAHFMLKKEETEREIERLCRTTVTPSEKVNALLRANGSTEISTGTKLSDLIKRPELDYFKLAAIDETRPATVNGAAEQANISIKYEGYVNRQKEQAARHKKMENLSLSVNLDYSEIKGLRLEARQKLNAVKPENIGMASRIAGVSPSDISVLLVYLEKVRRQNL